MRQIEEMLPLVQEQFFKELLLGNFRENDDILKRVEFLKIRIKNGGAIRIISIKLPDLDENPKDKSVANSYLISYSIKNIIASSVAETMSIFPVQISGTEYGAILFNISDEIHHSDGLFCGREYALNISVNVNQEISRRLGINTTMGISKVSTELKDIPLLYKQSVSAVNTMFYSGSNPIILLEEVEDSVENSFEEMPNMDKVYQEIRTLISFGSDQDIKEFIEKYLDKEGFKRNENYVKSFTLSVVNMIGILLIEENQSFKDIFKDDVLLWKKLSRFHTILDVKQWIYNVFKTVKEHLAEKNIVKNVRIVNAIKEFIKNNYNEQISINDISKAVYFSGRYANSLFKKETGKTIFDYVIEYRMEKAKKLLREQDSKVALVAEAVGYTNNSYFCLSFKKIVGMTPAEYKRKGITQQ